MFPFLPFRPWAWSPPLSASPLCRVAAGCGVFAPPQGCSVRWACHYGLLGAYTAVLTNGVGLFRAVLCYHNDKPWAKSRGWVALLLGLYAGCALLTWDGLYCLLPCLSMACTTLALWTHNMPRTRLLFLLNSPPLLAYNLITGAYSCALVEVCALISFAVAIYRFDLRGKKARLPQR